MKKCISITSGDPNGIGPEITLKTLQQFDLREVTPLWHIHRSVFDYYTGLTGIDLPVHVPGTAIDIKDGVINLMEPTGQSELTVEPGEASMRSVSDAIESCLTGSSDAMVTAPISKKAISLAGYQVPGHT